MRKIAGFSNNVFFSAVIVLTGKVQLLLGIIGEQDPRLLISRFLKMYFTSCSVIFNVICDVFSRRNEKTSQKMRSQMIIFRGIRHLVVIFYFKMCNFISFIGCQFEKKSLAVKFIPRARIPFEVIVILSSSLTYPADDTRNKSQSS